MKFQYHNNAIAECEGNTMKLARFQTRVIHIKTIDLNWKVELMVNLQIQNYFVCFKISMYFCI